MVAPPLTTPPRPPPTRPPPLPPDTLNSAIRTIFLDDRSVTWLAGDGVIDDSLGEAAGGFVDGIGTMASFQHPEGVAVDSSTGTVFVADTGNNAIRTVALDTGAVGTLAGGSGSGSANGIGTLASFRLPRDVAFDPTSGTVFVADTKNDGIRTVASDTGAVATFAGGGGDGNDCVGCRSSGYGFDDGIGTLASFNYPSGLAFDPSSDTLYVADEMNNAIRTVASDGTVKTLAGSGSYGANNAVGTWAKTLRRDLCRCCYSYYYCSARVLLLLLSYYCPPHPATTTLLRDSYYHYY